MELVHELAFDAHVHGVLRRRREAENPAVFSFSGISTETILSDRE